MKSANTSGTQNLGWWSHLARRAATAADRESFEPLRVRLARDLVRSGQSEAGLDDLVGTCLLIGLVGSTAATLLALAGFGDWNRPFGSLLSAVTTASFVGLL